MEFFKEGFFTILLIVLVTGFGVMLWEIRVNVRKMTDHLNRIKELLEKRIR